MTSVLLGRILELYEFWGAGLFEGYCYGRSQGYMLLIMFSLLHRSMRKCWSPYCALG